MTTATVSDIQHNLAAYLRRVEAGEAIEIRRHNKVVARLVPGDNDDVPGLRVDWSDMRTWRRQVWGDRPLPGTPTSEIVYESRGDR